MSLPVLPNNARVWPALRRYPAFAAGEKRPRPGASRSGVDATSARVALLVNRATGAQNGCPGCPGARQEGRPGRGLKPYFLRLPRAAIACVGASGLEERIAAQAGGCFRGQRIERLPTCFAANDGLRTLGRVRDANGPSTMHACVGTAKRHGRSRHAAETAPHLVVALSAKHLRGSGQYRCEAGAGGQRRQMSQGAASLLRRRR
jgi:hypothetical protein